MDMKEIRDELEDRLGFKVRVRYKAIFRGRQIPRVEGERPVQAVHIEISMLNFQRN